MEGMKEIFFRSEIIDQKAIVDESTGNAFPVFTPADINIIYNHFSIVCFQQIQHQSEKSCFTGTVVSYQSEHIALIDFIVIYVHG